MTPTSEVRVALGMHIQLGQDSYEADHNALDPAPEDADRHGLAPLTLTVTPGDEGRDFVCIKDYVLAVHSWLVSWRPAVLRQNGTHHNYNAAGAMPWSDESLLWFDPMEVAWVNFFSDQSRSFVNWGQFLHMGQVDREWPGENDPLGGDSYVYIYQPVYPAELLPDSHFANSPLVRPSLAFLRLRWTIPIPTSDSDVSSSSVSRSISVLEDVYDPLSAQVPFQNDENGQYHEIAAMPFSRPPCRKLEAMIDRMDGCEEWKLWTEEEDRVEDPDSAPRITVRAGDGRDFISVGDYVAQVHPWLVALRPQMLKELGLTAGFTEWEEDTQLWIDPTSPQNLKFFTDVQSQQELDGSWQGPARLASKG